MKKTYFNSPAFPLMTFIGFTVSLFLVAYFEHHIFGNETRFLGVVTAVGIICLIGWLGLIIRIDSRDRTITRYLFPFFVKAHALSDIVSVTDEVETDAYGKHPFTEIRFKNGDKWNLTMFSRKDVAEIKRML